MADWTGDGTSTATRYEQMADLQLHGVSPTYEAVCRAVAADPGLLARLDALPRPKRQPNLLLGAVRYLGGPTGDPEAFLAWAQEHWDVVEPVVRARRTQTNEPRRCATLLPALAALPQPLALIEVGASAGLCLHPDRYAYRYRTGAGVHALGDSAVVLACDVTGPAPLPSQLPEIVWRAGLDLDPLDVTDPDDVRWLEALIWPEQTDRFERLHAAVDLARADPPDLRRGDLLTDLPELVHDAPLDATLVVFHSAVLAYLGADDRARFAATVHHLGRELTWISNEGPGVVTGRGLAAGGRFVLARDLVPVALTGPHGNTLDWL